jgi:hypothetical protein
MWLRYELVPFYSAVRMLEGRTTVCVDPLVKQSTYISNTVFSHENKGLDDIVRS